MAVRRPSGSLGSEVLAICVCDGCGSAARAGAGARLTCLTAAAWLATNFEAALSEPPSYVAKRLVGKVQNRIRNAAFRSGSSTRDYASTLLGVVVDSSGRWIAVHIGDGGIVGRFGTELTEVCRPEKGEFANQTYFVTDSDAAAILRVIGWDGAGEHRVASGFALFTDGAEGSLLNRRTGQVANGISRMLSWFESNTEAEIASAIDQNITEVFQPRNSDDCTLVIAVVEGTGSWSSPHERAEDGSVSMPVGSPGPGPAKQRRRHKHKRRKKRRKWQKSGTAK